MTEQFSLQRQTRPIRKRRVAATQRGLVEKSDHCENDLPYILCAVTSAASLLLSNSKSVLDLGAKRFGVGNCLAVVTQPHNSGEHFLKGESKIPATPVRGGTLYLEPHPTVPDLATP